MDDSVDDSTLHSGHYSDTEYYQRNVVNLVFGPNFPQAYNHWFEGQRYKSLFDVWEAKIADGQNACNTEASEDEFFQTVLRRNQRDLDKLNPAKNFRRTPEYAAAGAERKLKSQQAKTALFQHQFITLRQKKLTKRAPKKRPQPKPSSKTPAPKRPLHSGTPASPMSIDSSLSSSPTPSLSDQPSTSSKPDVQAEPPSPLSSIAEEADIEEKIAEAKKTMNPTELRMKAEMEELLQREMRAADSDEDLETRHFESARADSAEITGKSAGRDSSSC